MRYTTHINNVKCLEWGLNSTQGALFDLLNQLSSWAKEVILENTVFYFISKNKILEELPLFFNQTKPIYRNLKILENKGLILYLKKGKKDLIKLTEKGKRWNSKKKEKTGLKNPNGILESQKKEKKDSRIPKNGILESTYNTTNKNHNSTKRNIIKKKDINSFFEKFYEMYPIKKGKSKGKVKFFTLFKNLSFEDSKKLFKKMMQGLEEYCYWIKNNISEQKYIQHFSTYMNKKTWEDKFDNIILNNFNKKNNLIQKNNETFKDFFNNNNKVNNA